MFSQPRDQVRRNDRGIGSRVATHPSTIGATTPISAESSEVFRPTPKGYPDADNRSWLQGLGRYDPAMGVRNFLIEGRSGSGKTTVCEELLRRGYQAIHGDRVLAYQGDPETGEPDPETGVPVNGGGHPPDCDCLACLAWRDKRWIWNVELVRSLVADHQEPVTFFCGGSRNSPKIIQFFDGVFVLDVDLDTLLRRLERRPADEFGGKQSERDFTARLHGTTEGLPEVGMVIDTSRPLGQVVDEIIRHTEEVGGRVSDASRPG
jgi:hypothetical protein